MTAARVDCVIVWATLAVFIAVPVAFHYGAPTVVRTGLIVVFVGLVAYGTMRAGNDDDGGWV